MPGVDRLRATAPGGLSWGLRFDGPHDPETLIALDLAEALDKARERAAVCRCAASLWRGGEKVADVPSRSKTSLDGQAFRDLIGQLNGAGWYVVGGPTPWDREPQSLASPSRSDD